MLFRFINLPLCNRNLDIMRKNITRIMFGAAIVIVAVFILLNALGVIHLGNIRYWDFWPVILIIAGIGAMITDKPNIWNLILTGTGIFFLCLEMGWIQSRIAKTILICTLLIILGVWLMIGWIFKNKKQSDNQNDYIPPQNHGYYQNNETYQQNPYTNGSAQGYSNYDPNQYNQQNGYNQANQSQGYNPNAYYQNHNNSTAGQTNNANYNQQYNTDYSYQNDKENMSN